MRLVPKPTLTSWPEWLKTGANLVMQQKETPLKTNMEPTETMPEAATELPPVINQPAPDPITGRVPCDQCGKMFKNAHGIAMHKVRQRMKNDPVHPPQTTQYGGRPLPPSMQPEARRLASKKRYARIKREKARLLGLTAAEVQSIPRATPAVEVGEIVEHPHVCPRCKLDLDAIAAAMNLRRR